MLPAPPLRVLLAEDERVLAELLSELLNDEGDEVRLATRSSEALEHARSAHWDAILVDSFEGPTNRLDEQDATYLRELSTCGPVIVLSARSWARDADPAAVVPKPFDTDELLETIRTVAGGHR